jgi:hypothetical protein
VSSSPSEEQHTYRNTVVLQTSVEEAADDTVRVTKAEPKRLCVNQSASAGERLTLEGRPEKVLLAPCHPDLFSARPFGGDAEGPFLLWFEAFAQNRAWFAQSRTLGEYLSHGGRNPLAGLNLLRFKKSPEISLSLSEQI